MIQVFSTNFPPQNTPVVDSKQTVTTPWMAFFRDLYNRTGQGTGLVNQVATNQAPGPITTDWVLTSASGTYTLPSLTGGQIVVVQDGGGGSTINAPVGATIDGSTSFPLSANKMQIFWFFSSTQIFSTQL